MSKTQDAAAAPTADGGFADLGVRPELIETLERLKIDAPTEIQRQMIPALLAGRDCFALAHNGMGKTNAYMLPVAQLVAPGGGIQFILIQPTPRIAGQVERNIKRLVESAGVKTALVENRRRGRDRDDDAVNPKDADIIVGATRAVNDFVQAHGDLLGKLRMVVVDECDAIIDLGDRSSLEGALDVIVEASEDVQLTILSGETDGAITDLCDDFLHEPERASAQPTATAAERVRQLYFYAGVDREARFDGLVAYCKRERPRLGLVFVSDAEHARDLAKRLERCRINARCLDEPGRRGQRGAGRRPGPSRGDGEVIIAADPAPRRLSTIPATVIVHYELPGEPADYLRRIEQCSRLHRSGISIAVLAGKDREKLERIAAACNLQVSETDAPPPREEREPRERRDSRESRDPRGGKRGQGDRKPGRGGERGGGRRGESHREEHSDSPAPATAAPAPAAESTPPTPAPPVEQRLRDEQLEAEGATHVPMNLGSRFPLRRKKGGRRMTRANRKLN